MTARQRSLYLAGRLYELAAEFTDAELRLMLDERPKDSKGSAIRNAIRALMELHEAGVEPRIDLDPLSGSSPAPDSKADQRTLFPSGAAYEAESLASIFEDRNGFPTVADIAQVILMPMKPKEARDRYVARAVRWISDMDKKSRSQVLGRVAAHLNRRPENFISKWSNVIKAL